MNFREAFIACCERAIQSGTYEESKALICARLDARSLLALSPKTFDSVFTCDSPTLASFLKYRGEDAVKTMVGNELAKLSEFYTVGRKITNNQLIEASELIIETYPHWKISDIKLLSKMAKKAQLGDTYDRFDGGVIMEWCKIYNEQRLQSSSDFTTLSKSLAVPTDKLLLGSSKDETGIVSSEVISKRLQRIKKINQELEELRTSFYHMENVQYDVLGKEGEKVATVERSVRAYNQDDIKHILNLYIDVTNTEVATIRLFEFLDKKWRKEHEEKKSIIIQEYSGNVNINNYLAFKSKRLYSAIDKKFNGNFVFEILERIVKEQAVLNPSELHKMLWNEDFDFGKVGLYKSMLMQVAALKRQASDLYYQYAEAALKDSSQLTVYNRIPLKKDIENCIIIRKLYTQTGTCLMQGEEVWEFLDNV